MTSSEFVHIARSATLKISNRESESRPLAAWRHLDAFVLLAEPGAGKTTSFVQEAEALKGSAIFLTARDFVALGPPEGWTNEVLFIDALDERRSTTGSATAPIDEIRKRLLELGKPKFRLSCREADWIAGGAKDLAAVAPGGKVEELWLDPLSEADIRAILGSCYSEKAKDVDLFLEMARRRNLGEILPNPLLLNLLIDAVRRKNWPDSRTETYELACRQMACEYNPIHRTGGVRSIRPAELYLEAAGKLCAMLLLSDTRYLTLDPSDSASESIPLASLPDSLGIDAQVLQETVDSKLFSAEGDRRTPRHRTIAEFLGGRTIADLVQKHGLPIQRALALITSSDGGIVEPLRGLHAWIASHCPTERSLLIDTDPLGLILYGDVRPFSVSDKLRVLDALRDEATRFPWFRNENWEAHPFGSLGTADMEPAFRALLQDKSRELPHQALLDCVADAIEYGDPMPSLCSDLESIVRDSTYTPSLRKSALSALLRTIGENSGLIVGLLDDIKNGSISDEDDELCGRILSSAYPDQIAPLEVLRFFHPRKAQNLIGWFHLFWVVEFPAKVPLSHIPEVLDHLASIFSSEDMSSDESEESIADEFRRTAMKLLVRGLDQFGDKVTDLRLYRWLGIGLNRFGSIVDNNDEAKAIKAWFDARPDRIKSIYLAGARLLKPVESERRPPVWTVENHLYRAKRPRDWFLWLLQQAAVETSPSLVKSWIVEATCTAVDQTQTPHFDITLDDIESWRSLISTRWPEAEAWIQEASSCILDGYQRDEHSRRLRASAQRAEERRRRHEALHSKLPEIFEGSAPPRIMADLAGAYTKRFIDITGETPLERVMDFLVVSEDEAVKAIEGIKAVLRRGDLPSYDEIRSLHTQQRHFVIYSACLLAAELVFEDDPSCIQHWNGDLVNTLIAFHLINGAGRKIDWFDELCRSRPELVRLPLSQIVTNALRAPDSQTLVASHLFNGTDGKTVLAATLIPALIDAIPANPSKEQLRLLNSHVLPGAFINLSSDSLHEILERRLSQPDLTLKLRVAFRYAALRIDPSRHVHDLLQLLESNPEIISTFRELLSERNAGAEQLAVKSPKSVGLIAEALAKHAVSTGRPSEIETDSPLEGRRRVIHQLVNELSMTSDPNANQELRRLRELSVMSLWWSHVEWCLRKQTRLSRLASFSAPRPSVVAGVLLNRSPANARDLAALVLNQLSWKARQIRFDEANQLQLFWGHSKTHGCIPRSENASRDILLGLVRDRLLLHDVQLEKEAFAAGDKRADLQATAVIDGKRIVVPIEIKKDNHPDLWTAWRDQLEQRYTTNPATDGIGIYLVLWFNWRPKASPERMKPRSAEHVAELFSKIIPADRWSHLFGLVIDLSSRDG